MSRCRLTVSPRLEKLCALLQGRSASVPSFFPGPCRRQFLEISDFGLGNQLTAFLSEEPLETCGENFELMNSQRTEVKHRALAPSGPWGQRWGGSDVAEALFCGV